ncbi:MAG: MFS transporter [Hyphomonadaceae bacterium]
MADLAPVPAASATSDVEQKGGDTLWRRAALILAAALGMAVCMPTIGFSYGLFMAALESEFGWSRTSLSLVYTIMSTIIFVGAVPVGWLADRLGASRVAGASMAAFGAALIAAPFILRDPITLWISYGLMAVLGLGAIPSVLIRPLIIAFSGARGLAVGLALTGIGLGATLLPQFVHALIERGGYRLAYFGLGGLCLLCAPILLLALRGPKAAAPAASASGAASESEGASFAQAARTRTFWLLSLMSVLGIFGVYGVSSQLVPFLHDQDMTISAATNMASLFGFGSMIGRVGTGFVLDRLKGPVAGALPFLCGACGALLLVVYGPHSAVIAVLLVGFAMGAEVDIMAYFVSRYFGVRHHGAIFGWIYGVVALGGASAPLLVAALRDHLGDYDLGFTIAAAALIFSALLCPSLGRYQFATRAPT